MFLRDFLASADLAGISGVTAIQGSLISATGMRMVVEGPKCCEVGSLTEGDADGTWIAILCW